MSILRSKSETFLQSTGKFKKFEIIYRGLSMEDM